MIHKTIGLLLLSALLSGCATTTQGPLQRISIGSDPPGAEIDARRCGISIGRTKTPATILVSRRATDCEIVLERIGYYPVIVSLNREISGTIAGNLNAFEIADCSDCPRVRTGIAAFIGALAGFLVDAGSGAMYELQPADIFIDLDEEQWRTAEGTLEEDP
jgi:hypothetical protein